ncbi:MAG: cytosolic protein [Chloroflexota bacterium]
MAPNASIKKDGQNASQPKKEITDYDSPWKDILTHYFKEFIQFFFPKIYTEIDWSRGYHFKDKELQQATKDATSGRQYADKLVQVWRNDGSEQWVLIHIEIQSQHETNFAQRVFIYYYRFYDIAQVPIASLVIFADESGSWQPKQYEAELWDCKVTFELPSVKLHGYRQKWHELEQSKNPFAVVVMAHLKSQDTLKDVNARLNTKVSLVRELYKRGYTRIQVAHLFKFIDWVLHLPKLEKALFWQQVQELEEEKRMQYITSIEEIGYERGFEEAIEKALQQALAQGRTYVMNIVQYLLTPNQVELDEIEERLELIESEEEIGNFVTLALEAGKSGLQHFMSQLPQKEE